MRAAQLKRQPSLDDPAVTAKRRAPEQLSVSLHKALPPKQTKWLLCTMAFPSTNITFAGDSNHGLQIGNNSGAIHLAPGKCPLPP
jgi:hypothetical protein